MFALGLLYTLLSYQQTSFPAYDATVLTCKLGYRHDFSPGFQIFSGGYFTAVPLKSNSTVDVRYLGGNIRAGFSPPFMRSRSTRWTTWLGGYYTTMFVSNDQFGFQNMSGPQILESLAFISSRGNELGFYAKFSPISSQTTRFALSNRELAIGASWSIKMKKGAFSLEADVANIHLETIFNGVSVMADSLSTSMGMSYAWN